MDLAGLREFIQKRRYGVLATVAEHGRPEAALVGIAVGDDLELVFDAIDTTRKIRNLGTNPHIAFVIGWQDDQTVQYEGIADQPAGDELERIKRIYNEVWPSAPSRDMWPGHTYVRVRPKWIRFSSYSLPYKIEEFIF